MSIDFNDRIGEIRTNKESLGNYRMKIIKYNNYQDVTVEFMDKYKTSVNTNYNMFRMGSIKNPYHPKVFNVGFLGVGRFKCREDGKITKCYNAWSHMICRCYDPYSINKRLTYKDIVVCEEWYNFQNFAKWYEENYYEIDGEKMCLDKDILVKDSKIYSPETCCFVPERINLLFIKRNKQRGSLPLGLTYDKQEHKIKAQCNIFGEKKYLGSFDMNQVEEAFKYYKQFKEKYIKQVADEYKDKIPKRLYDAMSKYKIEIGD